MNILSFLKLVEIQTKVASVIPFLIGTLYCIYRYNTFILKNFILMFISLLCIDMATTAINNYQDYKKAIKKHGYGYEYHNAIVSHKLNVKKVREIIYVLMVLAVTFGLLLYINTNIIVLFVGAVSFTVGILYSYGPLPISRTPFGEILSGFTMGFFIIFLAIYIHIFDKDFIMLAIYKGIVNIQFNLIELIYVFLISLTSIISIANIMLANNICDIEEDIENKRYTLPIYIGKDRGLKIFKISYYLIYVAIMISIGLRILPYVSILILTTLIPVNKNIKAFYEYQSKKDTFVLAVKNFLIINGTLALTLLIGLLISIVH
ncbi:MAG: 1,4-dihydroxy-2-naphthoate polyprenyltransferase [Clostridiales bacterium]|nr:1,4-dihydroxy-2-naphthoate polyprenyltransferase [Clostridiales bacterium]